jgi:hypothetical protein
MGSFRGNPANRGPVRKIAGYDNTAVTNAIDEFEAALQPNCRSRCEPSGRRGRAADESSAAARVLTTGDAAAKAVQPSPAACAKNCRRLAVFILCSERRIPRLDGDGTNWARSLQRLSIYLWYAASKLKQRFPGEIWLIRNERMRRICGAPECPCQQANRKLLSHAFSRALTSRT